MLKILVTGGGGFVGRSLTKRLIEHGHQITITATGSEPVIPGVFKTVYMGLDGIAWDQVWNKDVLFHQMANNDTLCKDKDEMFRANVYGPMTLFYQCLNGGCKKFIYASSTAVYGDSPAPYVEDYTPVNPLNYYGESKAKFDEFAMDFAKENNVEVIGLRYCNIYGPGEEQKGKRMSMVGQLLRTMLDNKKPKIFNDGEQQRDWLYVNDVVDGNILAMKSSSQDKKGKIYNIGTGESHSFNCVIDTINKVIGKKIKPEYVHCDFKETYQSRTACDISKIKRELGFIPKFSLESGITKYYQEITFAC
jgi:ADP-L-glycero-D-manno-heptose 6-epimerase